MVKTKSQAEMADPKVQAKTDATVKWCVCASGYLLNNGGKAMIGYLSVWVNIPSQSSSGGVS